MMRPFVYVEELGEQFYVVLGTVVRERQIDCLRGCQPSTIFGQRRACALSEYYLLPEFVGKN
jgi:hypothetical protein